VRRWRRRARTESHLAWLRRLGVEHAQRLDAEVLTDGLQPQPTDLGDALEALAAAGARLAAPERSTRRRVGTRRRVHRRAAADHRTISLINKDRCGDQCVLTTASP